ncbi:VPLPA-CTERM sorting domain-containing protein [Salipiger thiooxidans]|uniref:VPLPA-CTERM sorting domain-containing protein n=1 Tax=Salipiger thiooxidans TaxID=282683 RepID=UPI001CD1A52D|nr:VPLPA-CTERM sorting domain-containing protein [Salipiger thiooxidans]MCA0849960.1 VPLPA-CTERM sorting domain-containing protein [Salipiger thiooxidans]
MIFATKLKSLLGASLIGAGILLGGAQHASAVTFGFDNIVGGDPVGDAYAGDFSLKVTDLGASQVLFQVVNAAAPGSNSHIRWIFVEDKSPSAFTSVPSSNDVGFSDGTVNMAHSDGGFFPQGSKIGFDPTFKFVRLVSGKGNAIQPGETAGFLFNVAGDFNSIISSLISGQLRFGIHLHGLPGGATDSYVNSVTPVPLPAAGVLLIGALGGLGFASRRQKRMAV